MSASLLRSLKLASSSSAALLLQTSGRSRQQLAAPLFLLNNRRPISTSKKNRDVTATVDGGSDKEDKDKPRADDFSYEAAKKKWVSFGFDWRTEEQDLQLRNFTMFITVTCCLVGFSFLLTYYPDIKRRHWNQREAYIELARREALGLPLIDENLVPPSSINLPTEEELGDFEIII